MAYRCVKCSYEINKAEIPKRCPYCASEGTIEKIPTAQDVLDML